MQNYLSHMESARILGGRIEVTYLGSTNLSTGEIEMTQQIDSLDGVINTGLNRPIFARFQIPSILQKTLVIPILPTTQLI